MKKVLVLDFGGQYNLLVARRVRECGVYCEIKSFRMSMEEVRAFAPDALIFTGGPATVFEPNAPMVDKALFDMGFTEVGYVGRDVESIIRDLTANAVRMVHKEFTDRVATRAAVLAEDRLVTLLIHPPKHESTNPFEMILGNRNVPSETPSETEQTKLKRSEVRQQLQSGELEEREIEIEVEEEMPELEVGGGSISFGDMLPLPKKKKIRRLKVKEARKILIAEESDKLIDKDAVNEEAVARTEQHGIVFIDEIDKIAGRSVGGHGPDVSREGVQRDILPIVEGCAVNTKYGVVRTDFILFIASGAFHVAKVWT